MLPQKPSSDVAKVVTPNHYAADHKERQPYMLSGPSPLGSKIKLLKHTGHVMHEQV